MIADSMKDLDDEDISDTEDPDLMVCLPLFKMSLM